MATDEIAYNSYFHLLQDKFRCQYDRARNNSWLVCIPSSEALRGIEVDEHFVELHTLCPISDCDKPSCYASSDELQTLIYELHGDKLTLLAMDSRNADSYCVNIISQEVGYNKKLQPYKLLIVDKLLSPQITATLSDQEEWMNLNGKISSLAEAQHFLQSCPSHAEVLPQLSRSVSSLGQQMAQLASLEEACATLRHAVRAHWSSLLTTHPLHRQRDSRFQLLLSAALENHIVSSVHEHVFSLACAAFADDDAEVHARTLHLARLGISPDQLGAPEDFAVPLPAAVVELAALDSLRCPIEKLACLRTCLDLILAQLKAALVDVQSLASDDEGCGMPAVSSDDLVPLLLAVLIHAKPLHLVSNLFYMEHCQWTLAPNDALSFSLVTFRVALQQLLGLKDEELRPRSSKVHRELALQDLILVTGEMEQPDRQVTSPLDRQLESIATMIEASTREFQATS